jgi:hypothetical protein
MRMRRETAVMTLGERIREKVIAVTFGRLKTK